MQRDAKKVLRIGIVATFFLLVLVYAFYRSYNLLLGVRIKNVSLENYTTYVDSVLEITGNAQHATTLTLNGREISINKDGDFKETIALLPGYNVVSINALDKFGHQDEKIYKVIKK